MIPEGAVLLENSRAKDFIGCYISFNKVMHKGSGSAYVICSKIQKAEQPVPAEDNVPKEKLSEEEIQAPEAKPILDLKKESDPKPEIVLPHIESGPEPDAERLQQQISSLKDNLSKAELDNERLKKQIKALKAELDKQKESDKLILGGEEFFPGEKKDIVLAAIVEALKGLESKTRRSDVLKGVLESNDYEKLLEKKRDAVEKILKGYDGLSGTMEKKLADLGLMITDVGRHYKIRYYNDSRYWLTMAKTPSDSQHGDKTLVAKIKKKML